MKIIHLATSLNGGAGSAALRMNNALNILGEESMIISRNTVLAANNSSKIVSSVHPLKKLESSGVTFLQSRILQRNNDLVTPGSISTYNIVNNIELEKADIIHIHAYYNLLSSSSLRRILMLGRPTFFTLHDQRLFTGGCHYSRDCTNFQVDCSECPQVRKPFTRLVKKSFSIQKEVFGFSENVELVSPSPMTLGELSWLLGTITRSIVLNNEAISESFFG